MPQKTPSIFDLMNEDEESQRQVDEEAEKRQRRKELIEPTGVKELFKDGKIGINQFTCVGGQCKACIKVCPTNALYWGSNGVEIIDDLCVRCGACVLNCMVDNCIKLERTTEAGKVEKFSTPREVVKLNERKNGLKRFERVKTQAAVLRRAPKDPEQIKRERERRKLYVEKET
jgi:NAD-dependent dihydropyrimidine dehydrogenase PreA subunit